MAQVDYRTTDERMNDTSAVPAGEYIAHIKESEKKSSRNDEKNQYLSLRWEILDGPCKGRLIFENLNIWNKNQQAAEIARRSMNEICIAAGFPDGIKDSSQLHMKAIRIKVAVKTDSTYGDQNVIKKYSSLNENPANQTPQAAAQPEQGTEQESKRPWP